MSDTTEPFNILGSFADPSSFDTGAAKLTNVRVVLRQSGEGKPSKLRLVGTPGLTQVSQPTASSCIVLCRALNTLWSGHANGDIYSGVETATPVKRGTVAVDATIPVIRMAEDITALAIASNKDASAHNGKGTAYTAKLTTGVVNAGFATSINFDPSAVCELDNRTVWGGASDVFAVAQSLRMFSSSPLAPATVGANSYAAKEARSDALIDLHHTNRNFWAFGEKSIEQFYDAGGTADFPFVPFTNSLIESGLANRRTLAGIHGKLLWVGTDNRVWLGYAQTGQPVSPTWLDLELQRLSNAGALSQLTAYAYAQGGDEFYVLTREGAWTLEMALSTKIWNFVQTSGRADSARRCAVEYAGGLVYVGLDSGHVCKLDIGTASEPAGVLAREVVTPWIGQGMARHVIDNIVVTSSLGKSAGAFTLDWSEDGFQTSKGTRLITFGTPGVQRAIARQLGSSRRRQVRLRYTGTTAPFEFDEFFGDVTGGN
jgi:hypothetical protein